MRCFFCIANGDAEYLIMAKVLVLSALEHTNLTLHCVYDGEENYFTEWLRTKNIPVMPWKISFYDDLKARYNGKKSLQFCRGTYLCMELPMILQHYNIKDEFVLYVDTDVMFNGNVNLDTCMPEFISCSTDWAINDWSRFGTGIILMNVPNLFKNYPLFLNHLVKHDYNFEFAGMGPCDQGAWNTFYRGKNEKLDQVYDWKPWWGINDNARIIHFSGPKPLAVPEILHKSSNNTKLSSTENLYNSVINENLSGYTFFLSKWNYYCNEVPLNE